MKKWAQKLTITKAAECWLGRFYENMIILMTICTADTDILAHFGSIPMLFDTAYNLHKMVGLETVRGFMKETFEKDFDDLSEKTKAEFGLRYWAIYEIVLGEEFSHG